MSAVSQRLADARDQATKLICDLGRKESVAEPIAQRITKTIENLNERWDALTDVLVRQRDERDRFISSLLDEIASLKDETPKKAEKKGD